MENTDAWHGTGRWLSFIGGLAMVLQGAWHVFTLQNDPAAGWTIFLGLLLIGAVAADHRRAPSVAVAVAFIMLFRTLMLAVFGGSAVDLTVSLAILLVIGFAAWDLRAQRTSKERQT